MLCDTDSRHLVSFSLSQQPDKSLGEKIKDLLADTQAFIKQQLISVIDTTLFIQ